MPAKSMKIKVPVSVLIESAEARKAQLIEENDQAKVDYEKDMKEWRKECVKALQIALTEARAGNFPEYGSTYRLGGYLIVSLPDDTPSRPDKPNEKPNTRQVDRDLALLRATTEETLTIGTDDVFAGYLS